MTGRLVSGATMLAMAWALATSGRAQTPAGGPSVQITSPEAGSYVTGVTLLSADVDPATGVNSATFFVDGRQTCTVTQAPYECEWNAGQNVSEHQIRAWWSA